MSQKCHFPKCPNPATTTVEIEYDEDEPYHVDVCLDCAEVCTESMDESAIAVSVQSKEIRNQAYN